MFVWADPPAIAAGTPAVLVRIEPGVVRRCRAVRFQGPSYVTVLQADDPPPGLPHVYLVVDEHPLGLEIIGEVPNE